MNLSIHAMRVLNHIQQNGLSDRSVDSFPEEVCPDLEYDGVYDELRKIDLIVDDQRLNGPDPILINPRKSGDFRRFVKRYRDAEVEWRVLTSISQRPDSAESYDAAIGHEVNGEPITEDEAHSAAARLLDAGHIKAMRTWGRDLLRPTLTPSGRSLLQNELSTVPTRVQETSMQNIDNSVTQNVQAGDGSNVALAGHKSNVTLTVQNQERSALADQLDQLREALRMEEGASDSNAVRDLLTRVDMLEEQVEDGGGKVPASLLERFQSKVVETLADESAQRVLPVLSTIYVLLGLPPLTA